MGLSELALDLPLQLPSLGLQFLRATLLHLLVHPIAALHKPEQVWRNPGLVGFGSAGLVGYIPCDGLLKSGFEQGPQLLGSGVFLGSLHLCSKVDHGLLHLLPVPLVIERYLPSASGMRCLLHSKRCHDLTSQG